jgi:mannose-6-phosphate isomerase-like protein (cupin superfamily)
MTEPKIGWAGPAKKEMTPWGETWTWSTPDTLVGKIIKIRAGNRTSLKYHRLKNKSFFVLQGCVEITFGNSFTVSNPAENPYSTVVIVAGETFSIQSECPYRIKSVDDSTIIEIGDRSRDTFVRLEDDYGRTSSGKD